MNNIVNTETEKEDKLKSYLTDGYKIIYPNKSNIQIELKYQKEYSREVISQIQKGISCKALNLWDRLFIYRNDLFLSPDSFGYGTRDLTLSIEVFSGDFRVYEVTIHNSKTELTQGTEFLERIEYILFNQTNKKIEIFIDDNFKTKAAKKKERIQNEKKKIEQDLDLDLD